MNLGRPIEHLNGVLDRAKALGFLGPGLIADHVRHAAGFLDHLSDTPHRLLDLGSGGGLPGLVLLVSRPDIEITLLDASARRCEFLAWAVSHLGAEADVVCMPAEEGGRPGNGRREVYDAVVARSFASPAVTAELAAGFVRVGGRLVVSEPPSGDVTAARWDAAGLQRVGWSDAVRPSVSAIAVVTMTKTTSTDDVYPRRLPRIRRDPLWRSDPGKS